MRLGGRSRHDRSREIEVGIGGEENDGFSGWSNLLCEKVGNREILGKQRRRHLKNREVGSRFGRKKSVGRGQSYNEVRSEVKETPFNSRH